MSIFHITDTPDWGQLKINLTSRIHAHPIENARISISYTGVPDETLEELTTDSSGQTDTINLPAPPIEYSLDETNELQPYSEYTISVEAAGYESIQIAGAEILSTVTAIQNISMRPLIPDTNQNSIYVIPAHTLYGNYPAKIPEEEIKPLTESGEIVLSRVVIPEYIVVHNGPPSDRSAKDYYVPYRDYIKNVASSEIYSTWPEATLQANILAIQSFTLNRVFTEWYRNKGYDFTITSSTAYDHKWIPNRNVFESISNVVDEIFSNYLSRPGVLQPILTQYCDGKNVTCPNWMSQWGSKSLGDRGYTAIEILRNYYGSSMYINATDVISGVPSSYPGSPLRVGDSGDKVRQMQAQLNVISDAYPLIPKIAEDGIFGPATEEAVKTFQQIFKLTPDGIVGFRTWYKISEIYVGVSRIAEGVAR